jgi:hypothetical protein
MSFLTRHLAWELGSAGFVAINNLDSSWTAKFATSLPSGSYCDVISGASVLGVCTTFSCVRLRLLPRVGSSRLWLMCRLTVNNGYLVATVPPRGAIAVHTGAKGSGSLVAVTFSETATTNFGEVRHLFFI